MKKHFSGIALAAVFIMAAFTVKAQNGDNNSLPGFRVGIFAPLYLDSVFTEKTFRYKQGMPKFIVPALEFVQGAVIALDSMNVNGANITAMVYDSKSYTKTIPLLIQNKLLDSLDLIIGNVRDADYKQLADFALHKNIPFVSATYPNDGGITANPFTIIVNSTLKSHCEAIYSYILQNHGTDKIFLCRQKGTQEDKVAGYIKVINEQEGRPLLNIQTILFDSMVNEAVLKPKLDSNRQTVIIGGSLDEKFSVLLAKVCYKLSDPYPIHLIGMPNWDGFKALTNKDAFDGFPIYYTTPYFNNKWDSYSKILLNAYTKKYKGRPSDMAFKGFEMTWLFCKLLAKHQSNLMNNLSDKTIKVFCDYNFKPVLLKKENTVPDYFENKHLYFIKILNGTLSKTL